MGITGTTELKILAPYELSGGQQQRVALAGILAMKPSVVVMDEPTSFLDPVTAEEVMKAVDDLRLEHGITVIVVEHRLDLVSRYADRIIVMDSGKVVADGTVQDVLDGQFDQLTGLGVGVPRVSQLWAMLKRDGLVSGQTPKVVEAAAEKLGGKLSTCYWLRMFLSSIRLAGEKTCLESASNSNPENLLPSWGRTVPGRLLLPST